MSLLQILVKDLPTHPGRALLAFVDKAHQTVIAPSREVGNEEDHRSITLFIRSFAKKYELNVDFDDLKLTSGEYEIMKLHVGRVRSRRADIVEEDISREINEVLISYDAGSNVETFGLARLNSEEKRKIHDHLTRIRAVIEQSALTDRKKNALFERLNELAREVDAHGTHTDRFFAFAGDVAFVLGDMAEKAKPLLNEVRSMLRLVSRSRARQEGISLPPGDEPLKLARPDQELEQS